MNTDTIRQAAINSVYNGNPVMCSSEVYPEVRCALQEQAGKWIDQNDHILAQIALAEVKRLDVVHQFCLSDPDTSYEEHYHILHGLYNLINESGRSKSPLIAGLGNLEQAAENASELEIRSVTGQEYIISVIVKEP